MAGIASVRCTLGHKLRWNTSRRGYTHVSEVCDLPPDPRKTAWS